MTLDEARAVLGVTAASPPAEVREVYLRQVRANHPDTTDDPRGAGERTATIIAAYRLLRGRLPDSDSAGAEGNADGATATSGVGVEIISDEALWVDADGTLVGRLLLEAAHEVGEVSYVDRSSGLVQVTVRPAGGPTCWLTVSIHERPGGTALVTTLESIEALPSPSARPVVQRLADELGRRLPPDVTTTR